MSSNPKTPPGDNATREEGARSSVKWLLAAVLLLCLGAGLWHLRSRPSASVAQVTTSEPVTSDTTNQFEPAPVSPAIAPDPVADPFLATNKPLASITSPPAPTRLPSVIDPAMTALALGLMASAGTNGSMTSEAVQAWRMNLQRLVQSGNAAVPALESFLAQTQDLVFDLDTARALGYRSARLAAFDALRRIGSPEAALLLDQTLGTTGSPREVAALAYELDQLAQGQYRDKALARTRELLAASAGGGDPAMDVAPLFEVFQHYGDASVVNDLVSASSQWKYYAVSALANLPEGAGLPALVRMADPDAGTGDRLIALTLLAQLASGNQTAREAFLRQVTNRRIPASYWPYLNSPLAGDQYYPADGVILAYPTIRSWSDIKSTHINFGNQNFYQLPSDASLTLEGIQRRIAFLDELQAAGVASDPAAAQALRIARETLTSRYNRTAGPQ